MSILFYGLKSLVLPPFNLLLLALLGWGLSHRWRRLGMGLLAVAIAGLYLASTPKISSALLQWLEPAPVKLLPGPLPADGAIVVLGGGSYFDAPEYAGDTVSAATLERLRWAARLQRQVVLPVLVSGVTPRGTALSEARQMRDVLIADFGVPVRWMDEKPADTFESALGAKRLLAAEGISRIVLVTHASHMRRAAFSFEQAGLAVIPAATGYTTGGPASARDLLPSAEALLQTRIFMHEIIGIGWYHLRFAGRPASG
jgi:uncharacterized SAM-binding protein YcdF (DUF218 family)